MNMTAECAPGTLGQTHVVSRAVARAPVHARRPAAPPALPRRFESRERGQLGGRIEAASFDTGVLPEGTQIHAILLGGPDTRVAGPEPHIAPTLEFREAARTVFTHPALRKGFNPQPDPPIIGEER